MSDLLKVVESLENRIGKLLQEFDKEKQINVVLKEEIAILKSQNVKSKQETEQWRDKCESLKIANSILGSDQHKRETKLKINALVKEIDQCIHQLSQ